jgi:deoxyribose-phosphate aldolase
MQLELGRRVELVLGSTLATRGRLEALCGEARRGNFRGIVIPSGALTLAQHFLGEDPIKICCRIGGASGSMDPDAKRYETELAIDAGAHEIEIVPSLARIHDAEIQLVLREIRDVVEAADERPVKVALEPASWAPAVLRELVSIVLDSGAHYLCTSQEPRSGRLEELRELRELCGPDFGILARTGDIVEAEGLLGAGANLVSLLMAGESK